MTTVANGTALRRRVAVASMVGTTVEFYDFYVYATAAVWVFPQLFFAKANPTSALLASLATFGLAFVARPIGSVIFGHFGDRVGRKSTLVASLLTMGVATFLIGLLPTYQQAGLLAPGLLALMRFFQGLALGGEWSGAALLATETAGPGKRGWAAMWPQLGAPLGFLLANAVFLTLIGVLGDADGSSSPQNQLLAWGWRIPFLLSSIMVIIGLYVRLQLTETPVYHRAVQRGERVKAPVAAVLRASPRRLLIGTLAVVGAYTLFYLVTTWILSYATAPGPPAGFGLAMSYAEVLQMQLVAVLFFGAAIPIAGLLVDRCGRRRVLAAVGIAVIIYGGTFGALLSAENGSHTTLAVFVVVGMTLTGFAYGPVSVVLPELFPTNVRYTGSAIAFNVASILGAAVAPFIATWLAVNHGVGWVGIYLVTMAAVSLVAVLFLPEGKDISLDTLAGGTEGAAAS